MTSRPAYPLPRWIAHRGGGALAPENTLAGFRLAARLGFKAVEFDVMLSADGVPMLMHDETLLRTTGVEGRVPERSAAALTGLDAGARFHRAFAGEPVPRFEEVIAVCAMFGLAANVEIKPAEGASEATGEVVAEMVRAAWPAHLPVLLSSFDQAALAAAQRAAPAVRRAALFEVLPVDWEAQLDRLGCIALHCHHSQLETPTGKEVLAAQVPVAVYTVNRPELADQCWRLGAAAVFTDRLDLFG